MALTGSGIRLLITKIVVAGCFLVAVATGLSLLAGLGWVDVPEKGPSRTTTGVLFLVATLPIAGCWWAADRYWK